MNTFAHPVGTVRSSDTAGTVTLVLGVLFTVSAVLTYVLSLSDVVDPPNWARALALASLPIGLGGIPVAYAFARHGSRRDRARLGAAVALVGLVAFVALVVALG